jgi:hypothetical protein
MIQLANAIETDICNASTDRTGKNYPNTGLEINVARQNDTKVIGRLPGETSCLTLVLAVLDRASRGWRGLTMTADGLRLLQDLRRSLLDPPRQLRATHRHCHSRRQPPRECQRHRLTSP